MQIPRLKISRIAVAACALAAAFQLPAQTQGMRFGNTIYRMPPGWRITDQRNSLTISAPSSATRRTSAGLRDSHFCHSMRSHQRSPNPCSLSYFSMGASTCSRQNALATATVIDVYKRHVKPVAEDAHYLLVSKLATAVWGVFACVAAVYAVQLGSLIEVVNTFGSYFYGSILGVFILAIGVKRANGHGAFVGLIVGMAVVWAAVTYTKVAFLWLNVLGAVVVTAVGLIVSVAAGPAAPQQRPTPGVGSSAGGR